jgi:hypothetical protein
LRGSPLFGAGIAACAVSAVLLRHPAADPDLFARMAVGRIVEQQGAVVRFDPFSFTAPSAPWIDHEWLSGVVFYQIARFGGDAGLFLFKFLLLGIFLLLIADTARRTSCRFYLLPYFVAVFFCYYIFFSTIRCQVFTFVLLALFLNVFSLLEQQWRPLLLLIFPPAVALWANLHGGFVLGLFFLGLFALSRFGQSVSQGWQASAATTAAAAATLINPYGFDYWRYMFHALTLERSFVPEWNRISLVSPVGLLLLGIGGVVLFGMYRLRKMQFWPAAALLAGLVLGLSHLRLAAVPLLLAAAWGGEPTATAVRSLLPKPLCELRSVWELLVSGTSLAACVLALLWFRQPGPFQLDYSAFPEGPAAFLRQHEVQGRLLNGFNEGSFLLWTLPPSLKIALDGRYEEVYPESIVKQVRCIYQSSCSAAESELRRLKPDFILLDRRIPDSQLLARRFGGARKLCYEDVGWQLFATDVLPAFCSFGAEAKNIEILTDESE